MFTYFLCSWSFASLVSLIIKNNRKKITTEELQIQLNLSPNVNGPVLCLYMIDIQ